MPRLAINRERCKGCELCIAVCPQQILALSQKINLMGYHPLEVTHPERCTGCAICARMCPDTAISVFKED